VSCGPAEPGPHEAGCLLWLASTGLRLQMSAC